MSNIEILPSLLSMDFSCIKSGLAVLPQNAHMLHLDVMDGNFVENITFGPFIAGFIRKNTDKMLDAHLMITNPEKYAPEFAKNGVNMISFHIEACEDPVKLINDLHSRGVKAGIAVNPETDIHTVDDFLDYLDYVLVMSVHPGFAGQTFIHDVVPKLDYLKKVRGNRHYAIEIDGGINYETAAISIEHGADWLVTGSFLFKSGDMEQTIQRMKNEH